MSELGDVDLNTLKDLIMNGPRFNSTSELLQVLGKKSPQLLEALTTTANAASEALEALPEPANEVINDVGH